MAQLLSRISGQVVETMSARSGSVTRVRVAWSAVLVYAVLLTYLLLTPHPLWFLRVSGQAIERTVDHSISGYLQHALAYALLGWSLAWVSRTASGPRQWSWVALAMGHGMAAEWLQRFVPHRYSSWPDGLANILGVALGALTASLILQNRSRRMGDSVT